MKKILIPCLFALFLAPSVALAEAKPLNVVATFSILGDLVQEIGGERITVRTLIGPNADAHTYSPTPEASKALANADLVIENGIGFEGWMDRLVKASGYKGPIVVASHDVLTHTVGPEEGLESHHHHHDENSRMTDPHAWQDVSNVRLYVKTIAKALMQARPNDAPFFDAKAKAYDVELEKLDTWIKTELEGIPTAQRKIITSHDAFGYFASAYDVTFLSPQGVNTEIEPTATDVANLVNQMKAEKVRRVFFEALASPKLIASLAKDANAEVGKPVYSDALSKADGPATTYVSLMRYNVAQFKGAMALNGK